VTDNGADIMAFSCAGFGGCAGQQFDSTGFKGGVYGGYNWQVAPRWVLGLEADWMWGGQTATLRSAAFPSTGPTFSLGFARDTFRVKAEWDASVRGRVGFLVTPSIMAFATGGATFMSVEMTSQCGAPGGGPCAFSLAPTTATVSDSVIGWTVGGGVEAMITPNWSLRGEYRYADYGTNNYSVTRAGGGTTRVVGYDLDFKTHSALFGLAYAFGGRKAPTDHPTSVVAAHHWSGFYLGGAVGARSAQAKGNVTAVTNSNFNSFCDTLAPFGGCRGQQLDSTGAKGGIYAGYNWHAAPRWVLGVEADWMWADHEAVLSGHIFPSTVNSFALTAVGGDSFTLKTQWDASLRGRVGHLVTPSVLVFATAGVSWMSIKTSSVCTAVTASCSAIATLTPLTASVSDIVVGWTVGGGVEAMIAPDWLVRAEYRYADYGTSDYSITRTNASTQRVTTYDIDLKTHTALLGIAYKFGGKASATP